MGELEPIKNLPGMVRAAVNTLDKVWRAGIELSAGKHPRLQALHALEEEVLRRFSLDRDRLLMKRSKIRWGLVSA